MPDPFDNAKMTGDTHPPEVESDLPLEEGSAPAAGTSGTSAGRGQGAGRGENLPRGVKKAGLLKDDDGAAPGGDEAERESGRGTGAHPAG